MKKYDELIGSVVELSEREKYVMETDKNVHFNIINNDDVALDIRTISVLKRAGITSIEELRDMTEKELDKINNLGRKSRERIDLVLKQHNNQKSDIDTNENIDCLEEKCQDKRWEGMFKKFTKVWENAKKDNLSKETGFTQSIYLWGVKQIEEKTSLEQWKKDNLNEIEMVWEVEKYEELISPWLIKFNMFKQMYLANEEQLVKEYTVHTIGRFEWAIKEMVSSKEQWKKNKFKNLGIDSIADFRKQVNKKIELLQNAAYHDKVNRLNESRLKGDEEAIMSIKVIGKKIDYVRHNMVNANCECDYYEVSIQVCDLFDKEQFVEYVKKNKQRFIECGKQAIIEKRTKKFIVPFQPVLKVDKMVYGLASHMVTIMYSVQLSEKTSKKQ